MSRTIVDETRKLDSDFVYCTCLLGVCVGRTVVIPYQKQFTEDQLQIIVRRLFACVARFFLFFIYTAWFIVIHINCQSAVPFSGVLLIVEC